MFVFLFFSTDLFCIRLESRNWSLFTLWSTSRALSKQTWRNCSRVGLTFSISLFSLWSRQKNKWHLSGMINSVFTVLFILFAAHIANENSVIVVYRRAMCNRLPILGCIHALWNAAIAYIRDSHLSSSTYKMNNLQSMDKGMLRYILSIKLIYSLHFLAFVSLHYTHSAASPRFLV